MMDRELSIDSPTLIVKKKIKLLHVLYEETLGNELLELSRASEPVYECLGEALSKEFYSSSDSGKRKSSVVQINDISVLSNRSNESDDSIPVSNDIKDSVHEIGRTYNPFCENSGWISSKSGLSHSSSIESNLETLSAHYNSHHTTSKSSKIFLDDTIISTFIDLLTNIPKRDMNENEIGAMTVLFGIFNNLLFHPSTKAEIIEKLFDLIILWCESDQPCVLVNLLKFFTTMCCQNIHSELFHRYGSLLLSFFHEISTKCLNSAVLGEFIKFLHIIITQENCLSLYNNLVYHWNWNPMKTCINILCDRDIMLELQLFSISSNKSGLYLLLSIMEQIIVASDIYYNEYFDLNTIPENVDKKYIIESDVMMKYISRLHELIIKKYNEILSFHEMYAIIAIISATLDYLKYTKNHIIMNYIWENMNSHNVNLFVKEYHHYLGDAILKRRITVANNLGNILHTLFLLLVRYDGDNFYESSFFLWIHAGLHEIALMLSDAMTMKWIKNYQQLELQSTSNDINSLAISSLVKYISTLDNYCETIQQLKDILNFDKKSEDLMIILNQIHLQL